MSTVQLVECAGGCGAMLEPIEAPPEIARWAGLIRMRCAACVTALAEEKSAAERARRAQEREQGHARRLRGVGVPPHLRGYSFAHIDRPEGLASALARARQWAVGECAGLGLLGPMGVGKTRVGVAAANEACARVQAYWYSAPVLLAQLSGQFGSAGREGAQRVQLSRLPLVLDDVDKVRGTEYAAEMLFAAIDARADGGGQLLVTTNLNGPELARRWPQPYGEALADRLQLLSWVRVSGESKRNGGGR